MSQSVKSIGFNALDQLKTFSYGNNSPAALIIEKTPNKTLIPCTPINGTFVGNELRIEEFEMYKILEWAKKVPISYPDENNGLAMREVVPNFKIKEEHSSHGFRMPFGAHTDNPDRDWFRKRFGRLPIPPYLLLQGIRNEEQVPTKLISLDVVLQHLDEKVIRELQKPKFMIQTPSSGQKINALYGATILWKHKEYGFLIRYDKNTTTALGESGQKALAQLEEVLQIGDLWHEVVLTPGKMLLFKNMKCLHARPAFQGKRDGTDRWLRRLYAVDREQLQNF